MTLSSLASSNPLRLLLTSALESASPGPRPSSLQLVGHEVRGNLEWKSTELIVITTSKQPTPVSIGSSRSLDWRGIGEAGIAMLMVGDRTSVPRCSSLNAVENEEPAPRIRGSWRGKTVTGKRLRPRYPD